MGPDRAEPPWEASYRDDGAQSFGRPSAEIVRLGEALPRGSRVLDAGCGDGRNALFLARCGHRVEAFDRSRAGVRKLRRLARGLPVLPWVADLATWPVRGPYDLVVVHGVLHLLARGDRDELLARLKRAARPEGLHVIAVFTDAIPSSPDLVPFTKALFRVGELAGYYTDWTVEHHESYVLEDEHPGGIRHRHAIEKLIARRPAEPA
jgi:tellurite methyltransferase